MVFTILLQLALQYWRGNIGGKIPRCFKRQNLNFPSPGNYLHNIVLTAIYVAFTLY